MSDPIRLQIVTNVAAHGEDSCAALGIPVPKSTLSHHFEVLREAGITQTRLDGVQRYVSLRREDLEARFPGLLTAVLRAAERPARAPDGSLPAAPASGI